MIPDIFNYIRKGSFEGIYVSIIKDPSIIKTVLEDGTTPLMEAARLNKIKILKHLLENGASPDETDKYGFSSLMYACALGHLFIVRNLLEQKASVNTANRFGETPLMLSCRYPYITALHVLSALPEQITSDRVQLAWDVWHGSDDFIPPFVENSGYVIMPDYNAAMSEKYEIVKLLLNAGAKTNHASIEGNTALMHAAIAGFEKSILLLLEFNADRNIKNNDGETAKSLAKRNWQEKIADIL